ncbi:MAG: hypothetical protein ACPG6V_06050 [Flavobacteriales bacterium]
MNTKHMFIRIMSALITIFLVFYVVLYLMFIGDGLLLKLPIVFHIGFLIDVVLYIKIAHPHLFEDN